MKTFFFLMACAIPSGILAQAGTENTFQSLSVFDIVITEIMADPDPPVGLPNQEYCEIYNRSNQPVDLTGWTFFDGSVRPLPAVTLDVGEYAIICDDADTTLFAAYGKCVYVTSISLTNTGEKIALRNSMGVAVDSVTYSDAWFNSSIKQDGGWSLEKVDVNYTCPVTSNWKPSEHISGGTPGSMNSVAGSVFDNLPPVLLRAYCIDSSSVTLVFNESLDPDVALDIQHYSTTAGQITGVSYADALLQEINLTMAAPLTHGVIETVTVNGITDCSGNPVLPGSTVKFGIADTTSYKDLVLNEILFNPFEDGYDFVELYNNGKGIIDLGEVKIESYNLTTGQVEQSESITTATWLLFPGDFIVLTEMPEVVAAHYRSTYPHHFIPVDDLPAMNIDEGHIAVSFQGMIIDSFHYLESYHFGLLNDYKGISLEKINPGFPSHDATSWHSAAQTAGFATPGLINSQFTGINDHENQVQVTPGIFSPDNDGFDDLVTFSLKPGKPGYISNLVIYDSEGRIIFNNARNLVTGTSAVFNWDGMDDSKSRASAGIYVAVVEVFHLEGDVKRYRLPFVLAIKL